MGGILGLILAVIIFAAICYGAWWLCVKFAMPRLVFWIVGGLLLLVLILYAAQQLGINTGVRTVPTK